MNLGHHDRSRDNNKDNNNFVHGREERYATATTAAARASQQRHLQNQQQKKRTQDFRNTSSLCGPVILHSRGATATGIIARVKQTGGFDDQNPHAEMEALRPSTAASPVHEPRMFLGDGRGRGDNGISSIGAFDSVGVDVRVSVGGVRVGAAARARLYRGVCEQRGGEYGRAYRRHGGKGALERIALLNDTFL